MKKFLLCLGLLCCCGSITVFAKDIVRVDGSDLSVVFDDLNEVGIEDIYSEVCEYDYFDGYNVVEFAKYITKGDFSDIEDEECIQYLESLDIEYEHKYVKDLVAETEYLLVKNILTTNTEVMGYLTYGEMYVLLGRIFFPDKNILDFETAKTYSYLKDYTYKIASFDKSDRVDYDTVSVILSKAFDYIPYVYTLYDEPNCNIITDETMALYQMGYIENKNGSDYMTRTDFYHILYCMLLYGTEVPSPPILDGLYWESIGYDGMDWNLSRLRNLSNIETNVLEDYKESDWSLVVTDKSFVELGDYFSEWEYMDPSGLTSYERKTIYLRFTSTQDATIHEYGHYIAYASGEYTLECLDGLMEEEGDALVEILGSNYCMTNVKEFFAEAYKAYKLRTESFKERCPKTYEQVVRLISLVGTENNIK